MNDKRYESRKSYIQTLFDKLRQKTDIERLDGPTMDEIFERFYAGEEAKQEIVEDYSLYEASGNVSGTSDSPEPVAYVLRHECDRQGVHNQTLVWASSPFPHRCNVCRDLLDETHVHKTLVERSENGESGE